MVVKLLITNCILLSLVFLTLLLPKESVAEYRYEAFTRLELNYSYARLERSTAATSWDFLSRTGGGFEILHREPIHLARWDWGIMLGAYYQFYEEPISTILWNDIAYPWHAGGVLGYNMGKFGDTRLYFGLLGVGDVIIDDQGLPNYGMAQVVNMAFLIGFSMRSESFSLFQAEFDLSYYFPVLPATNDDAIVTYRGSFMPKLRLSFGKHFDWGIHFGAKISDFTNGNARLFYFDLTAGLHFDL